MNSLKKNQRLLLFVRIVWQKFADSVNRVIDWQLEEPMVIDHTNDC